MLVPVPLLGSSPFAAAEYRHRRIIIATVDGAAERDTLVVVAHPDDEVLWLGPFLPRAKHILVAYADATRDSSLNRGRQSVLADFPFATLRYLGLQQADVYGLSDFLSRVPVEYGVKLMRSCDRERARRYRTNFRALVEAVAPFVDATTDIYTHNPWGEYGHEEHVQVSHAMVALAQRHGCSVWAWDGLPSAELTQRDVWIRADYYPDTAVCNVPWVEMDVNLECYDQLRSLYQRHDAWTFYDDYVPPNPSRYLQIVRDGIVLVRARKLPSSRRAEIAAQVVLRKTRHYAHKIWAEKIRPGKDRQPPNIRQHEPQGWPGA
jgi:LmbE family N-acetylglucosaminyl deacetylase